MNLKPLDKYIKDLERSDTSGRATREKKRQPFLRIAALTAIQIAEDLKKVRKKLLKASSCAEE